MSFHGGIFGIPPDHESWGSRIAPKNGGFLHKPSTIEWDNVNPGLINRVYGCLIGWIPFKYWPIFRHTVDASNFAISLEVFFPHLKIMSDHRHSVFSSHCIVLRDKTAPKNGSLG